MKKEDIVNATRAITIVVPEKISNRTKNPDNCALAKACRMLETVEDAAIYTSTAYVLFKGQEKWKRFRVPSATRRQVIAFDLTGRFEPGRYKLTPIQPSHQATGTRQGTQGDGEGGNWKERKKHVKVQGVRAHARLSAL